jgi:hypothetical protein
MVRHCKTVHERRRNHQCPHCSSRFGRAGDMRRYCKTVHEKVRAHACIYCPEGVAFGETGHLNRNRAPRHADSIAAGLTSAGCKCQANWTHRGKALSGCANPSYTPNPLLDTSAHGEKREAWCKIVPGSCTASAGATATVRAGGDWDTCSKMKHVHLTIPMMRL